MVDMDTVVIRDRSGEYIHATLGPEGHKLSRVALMRMISKAIINSEGSTETPRSSVRPIDLSY